MDGILNSFPIVRYWPVVSVENWVILVKELLFVCALKLALESLKLIPPSSDWNNKDDNELEYFNIIFIYIPDSDILSKILRV